MKNIAAIIICLAAVCVSLAGCAKQPVEASASNETLKTIVEQSQSKVAELEKALDGKVKVSIDYKGDNTLVYSYTLIDDSFDQDVDRIRKSIEERREQYETIVADLETVGVMSPAVLIEWFDKDGNKLYSKEFNKR